MGRSQEIVRIILDYVIAVHNVVFDGADWFLRMEYVLCDEWVLSDRLSMPSVRRFY